MRGIQVGRIAGLQISGDWTAALCMAVVWALWSVAAIAWFDVPTDTAIAFGFLAVVLHWASDVFHQAGHAWAAHTTGHPSVGVHFWAIFSTIRYPANEPALPAAIHLRRAWGGPAASALLSLLGLLWVLMARDSSNVWRWLALFFFLDNFLVLTLQAAIPMGFNDGATIWHWARRHDQ